MSLTVPVPDYLKAIPPYRSGTGNIAIARETKRRLGRLIKLSSNENPLGMSPQTKAAIASLLTSSEEDPSRYPDPDGVDVRQALATRLDVPMDWITLGSGSVELLHLAVQAFLPEGAATVQSEYAYNTWEAETHAAGAKLIVVPAVNYGHDLDAMLRAVTDEVTAVFICNPNNPTGSFLTGREIDGFLAKLPPRVLVVLDEAYHDYVDPKEQVDTIGLVRLYPNLLATRTFSKVYGMAGLRFGYGVAQAEITEILNRLRPTFNVGVYPQVAALAALADTAFVEKTLRINRIGMVAMTRGLDAMGVQYLPSKANFVMVKVGDSKAVHRRLLDHGVQARPIANYGFAEWLRVSIGLPEENQAFLDALRDALGRNDNT